MRWRGEWKKIERETHPSPPCEGGGTCTAEQKVLPHREDLGGSLTKLLDYREADGRYLVARKVHWQAIFRILVDRGIYPDGTDYRGFCCYMEEVFPTAEWRVPLDYHSLKNISQTMFVRPFAEWRYDAVYNIKFKSYHQMYRIAALLDEQLSENLTRR